MYRVPKDSAHNFHKLGSEYLNAAHLVFDKLGPIFPGYTLIGQAMELYLKAFLRAKGLSVSKLKSIGHDLKLALVTAENLGISKHFKTDPDERMCLEKLSVVYKSKDFQYKTQGTWELPFPNRMIDFADRLSTCITY